MTCDTIFQVKLDPSLAEAWLCLSNCIWKKGDFFSARDILLVALDKVEI